MNNQNKLNLTNSQLSDLTEIYNELDCLKCDTQDFFATKENKPDDLIQHIENKALLNDMTTFLEFYISKSSTKRENYWTSRDNVDANIMEYWGCQDNTVADINSDKCADDYAEKQYREKMMENNLLKEVFDNIIAFAEKSKENLYKSTLPYYKNFKLQDIMKTSIPIGDALLKIAIAYHVKNILTGKQKIEPKLIWFIEFLATKLLQS